MANVPLHVVRDEQGPYSRFRDVVWLDLPPLTGVKTKFTVASSSPSSSSSASSSAKKLNGQRRMSMLADFAAREKRNRMPQKEKKTEAQLRLEREEKLREQVLDRAWQVSLPMRNRKAGVGTYKVPWANGDTLVDTRVVAMLMFRDDEYEETDISRGNDIRYQQPPNAPPPLLAEAYGLYNSFYTPYTSEEDLYGTVSGEEFKDLDAQVESLRSLCYSLRRLFSAKYTHPAIEFAVSTLIAFDALSNMKPSSSSDIKKIGLSDGTHHQMAVMLRTGVTLSEDSSPLVKQLWHYVSVIDFHIQRMPVLQEPIIVYRGVTVAPKQVDWTLDIEARAAHLKALIDNLHNTDKCFLSTSTELDIALAVADPILLVITVPPGSRVMPIRHLSTNDHEHEVLLPRNTQLEVTSYCWALVGDDTVEGMEDELRYVLTVFATADTSNETYTAPDFRVRNAQTARIYLDGMDSKNDGGLRMMYTPWRLFEPVQRPEPVMELDNLPAAAKATERGVATNDINTEYGIIEEIVQGDDDDQEGAMFNRLPEFVQKFITVSD